MGKNRRRQQKNRYKCGTTGKNSGKLRRKTGKKMKKKNDENGGKIMKKKKLVRKWRKN